MEKCSNCKTLYPDGYTSQMSIDGGYTVPVCAICALEMSNLALGINRTEFQGEIAEQMRQKAIEWRMAL